MKCFKWVSIKKWNSDANIYRKKRKQNKSTQKSIYALIFNFRILELFQESQEILIFKIKYDFTCEFFLFIKTINIVSTVNFLHISFNINILLQLFVPDLSSVLWYNELIRWVFYNHLYNMNDMRMTYKVFITVYIFFFIAKQL